MRKQINAIVTDSRAPGEPKSTEGSALFQIFKAFASAEETEQLAQAFADGIAWGDAKQHLFERLDREIAPMRASYEDLIHNPDKVERILKLGAEKALQRSAPFMAELRSAVGLRSLSTQPSLQIEKVSKASAPQFKQYREKDGQFYFKLVSPQGHTLLLSKGFSSPKEAGLAIAQLIANGASALDALQAQLIALHANARDEVLENLNFLHFNSDK
jgi:tryptophanyl-tRNA synthetase